MQNFEKARRFFNGLALVQKLKLTSLSLALLFPLLTIAQTPTKPLVNATLSGQVIDSRTSDPLPGALVQLEGVTHSVQTDRDGKFSFVTGQKLPVTLIISYLGYDKSSVVVTNTPVTIKLNQNQKQLSEVLVVGYGTQNKRDITGSVAKIKASEVIQQPVASFDAQLQGKAAGVQVITNSGVPGEGIFLRVRGTTSINSSSDPLYIVDGVFLNNSSLQATNLGGRVTSPLADINPADIESIEVLKDASATAIYGSRGANGVVLITTKKGNYNNKSTVSFNVANGWVQADKSTVPSLTTGPESALLANEWWINSGVDNPSLNQTFQNRPFRPVSEGGRGLPEEQPTYDRLGDLLRKGRVQDYSLAIQGGSNSSRYYIGGGYTDQEALIKVIKFSRASLKFNFDQKLSEKVSIGLTNSFSKSDRNQARTGDGPQVSLWNSAVSTATFSPKYGEDGLATGVDNTYTLIENYDVKTQSLRYVGSIFAEAELAKGLKFKTSFSLDYNNYKESAYWNTNTSIGKAVGGQANSDITQNNTWINEQTLTYQKQFGDHKLTLLAGNSFQSNTLSVNSGVGTGFANDNYKLISSASIRSASEGWTGYNLASFFGRAGYNYLNKYFAEATLRADGSSKFGTNNKWGYFPAFSLGWRLKEESYLRNVDWLSELKLRASYGITGNQSGIDNFASRGLWSGGSSYADVVGSPLPGIGPEQLGNADLRWEKTKQTDIGLDASFFNNRLSVTLDLYHKYTSDLLLQQPIPSATGFSVYWANVGEISNKGYELTINSTNLRTRHFTWNTDFNISGNKNKIEKLPSQITQYTRDWVILKEGYSMNSFWLYNQLYVDPNTGAPVFEGQDASGNVTAEDRKIIHSAYPKFYGGITNNFKYKNFDLGVAFSFQYGNYTLNLQRYFKERNASAGSVVSNVLNRWQKKGDITDIPRLTSVGSNYTIDQSSRYLEDASFLRLKQVTLGYNLPKSTFSKIGLSDVRVYFVGTNLLLWTKYTGDPESSITSNPNAQGLGGFGTPPQPKGFQFGLNVKL